MKRTALTRRTPLRQTVALARKTRLRAKPHRPDSDELYARLAVSVRSGGLCEIRLPGVCSAWATDWSHRIARGRGGTWTPSCGLAACRPCHSAITDTQGRRSEYEAKGYIVRTGMDTTTVAVWLAGERWVLLADDGTVADVEVVPS